MGEVFILVTSGIDNVSISRAIWVGDCNSSGNPRDMLVICDQHTRCPHADDYPHGKGHRLMKGCESALCNQFKVRLGRDRWRRMRAECIEEDQADESNGNQL